MSNRSSPHSMEPFGSITERPTVDVEVTLSSVASEPETPAGGGPPTVVGRYHVDRVLGVGGMGVVYAAYDPKLDRQIALKILHEKGQRSGTGRARMVREAQALARLNHPNIVAVHDVDVFEGRLYMAMEYVDGTALDRWLEDESRAWPQIVTVFVGAGRGLAAAHAAGITHRDFKPSNVVVGMDGRVRVLDFGLAKTAQTDPEDPDASDSRSDSRSDGRTGPHASGSFSQAAAASAVERLSDSVDLRLTLAGRAVGTPPFMSPEQLFGLPVNSAADQFSFAVALYEALYGQLPFADEDDPDLIAKIHEGCVRDPPGATDVPLWINRALLRALIPSPTQRFPSMDALLDALTDDPARRTRRRVLGVGLVALSAMAVYGVVQGIRPPPAEPCTGAANKIDAIWGAARQQAVREAFERTNVPYQAHAWGQIEGLLGQYTAAWSASHMAICQATNVRREQSPALMDIRMSCLARARAQVSGLIGEFEDADTKLVRQAVAAVQSLPELSPCEAEQSHSRETLAPEVARAIKDLRVQLAAIEATLVAGRADKVLALSAELLDRAREIGHPSIITKALIERGKTLGDLSRYSEVIPLYTEAITSARAAGEVEDEVRAWNKLIYAEAAGLEHFERALAHLVPAGAAVALLGETAPRLRAHLESSRGTALQRSGRYVEAGAALHRSAELFATLQTGPSLAVANALINQTIVLNHLGERERALETLERAAFTIETLLGQQHPRYGVVEINLGNLLHISHKEQDARLAYERGLKIYRSVYGVDSIRTARALIGLISVEMHLNDLDAARERGLEALQVLDSQTERPRTLVGAVQNLLGRTERLEAQRTRDEGARLTHLQRAQRHYILALEEFEVVFGGRPDERILKTNAELCSSLRQAGKRELARRRCLVALHARGELGDQPLRPGDALTLLEFGLLADDLVQKELLLWSGLQLYETLEAHADTIEGHFALAELWWSRPPARLQARALIEALADSELQGWERQRVAIWLRGHRAP